MTQRDYQLISTPLQAAGAALAAVDAVMEESGAKSPKGFALIRPPGHHATRDAPMGFCIFNNVAIAARYAQQKYQLKKVSSLLTSC
jgi:acetoin utilization deacetylase AcuC-like enzyme